MTFPAAERRHDLAAGVNPRIDAAFPLPFPFSQRPFRGCWENGKRGIAPREPGAYATWFNYAAALQGVRNKMRAKRATHNWLLSLTIVFSSLLAATGCHTDMRDQPRYEALEASTFFADGQSARPQVEGTVARGQLHEDEPFYTGKEGTQFLTEIPVKLNRQLLLRGQERFNIYCAVCHARTGNGDGMIVQRGFRRPPSFHIERLQDAPAGHFFDVMTNGFGAMPSYRVQVPPSDRWAIVAYIRVLQMSQRASLDDVPADQRTKLMEAMEAKP